MADADSISTTAGALGFGRSMALEYATAEHDKLYALISALVGMLEPPDANNLGDFDRFNEWRLAQLMEERLESTAFLTTLRTFLELDGPVGGVVR